MNTELAALSQDTKPVEQYTNWQGRPRVFGDLEKLKYSHDAMIDLLITQPHLKQAQLAKVFGYSPGWVSQVIASDAFQSRLAARRAELVDPAILASVEERFRSLTIQSLARLQEKLEAPNVSDNTVLRAVELGAKALGVGGNAAPRIVPVDLGDLKARLLALHGGVYGADTPTTVEGTSRRVDE